MRISAGSCWNRGLITAELELGARDEPIRTDRESRSDNRAKPSDGGPGGEGRGKRRSRCPLGRRGGPCLRPRRFQCGGAARTRGAESTNRREHRDRSQQGSAIPRRQGRQRCPQSADSEDGPPEEVCTTKEIRGAEVNVLSLCGRAGTAASALAVVRGASAFFGNPRISNLRVC